MLFTITNKHSLSTTQLRANTLLHAYYIIQRYPLHASELALDNYIQQQYKISLKNMCVKLLLSLTYYIDNDKNLVLLFKDPRYDKIAQLITYGNGVVPGSKILQIALNDRGGA